MDIIVLAFSESRNQFSALLMPEDDTLPAFHRFANLAIPAEQLGTAGEQLR